MADENLAREVGRHDERLKNLEQWRKHMEHKSTRLTLAAVGGIITLLVGLITALILAGIGVGA